MPGSAERGVRERRREMVERIDGEKGERDRKIEKEKEREGGVSNSWLERGWGDEGY